MKKKSRMPFRTCNGCGRQVAATRDGQCSRCEAEAEPTRAERVRSELWGGGTYTGAVRASLRKGAA